MGGEDRVVGWKCGELSNEDFQFEFFAIVNKKSFNQQGDKSLIKKETKPFLPLKLCLTRHLDFGLSNLQNGEK